MGRNRRIGEEQLRWAFGEWCRGCVLVDIAAVLEVDKRTLQRAFKRAGWQRPRPIPDEDWLQGEE